MLHTRTIYIRFVRLLVLCNVFVAFCIHRCRVYGRFFLYLLSAMLIIYHINSACIIYTKAYTRAHMQFMFLVLTGTITHQIPINAYNTVDIMKLIHRNSNRYIIEILQSYRWIGCGTLSYFSHLQ